MASTSYSVTPSDIRRNRAARFASPLQVYGVPSFSLGVEIETVKIPSSDTSLESAPNGSEHKCGKPFSIVEIDDEERGDFPPGNEPKLAGKRFRRGVEGIDCIRVLPSLDQRTEANLWRGLEDNRWKPSGPNLVVQIDSDEEDDFALGMTQKRVLKRLKRGPLSARKEPLTTDHNLLRSKDLSEGDRLRKQSSDIGSDMNVVKQPLSFVDGDECHAPTNVQTGFVDDVDEIEEFSEDELTVAGLRAQMDGGSSRARAYVTDPIVISSSPETSRKPVLLIPGETVEPTVSKIPMTFPHNRTAGNRDNDGVNIWPDDFDSATDWWRSTKPHLSKPVQTSANTGSSSKRADSALNMSRATQLDVAREDNSKSFCIQTPLRRDTVGPSQAIQKVYKETEESLIAAFLRQRLPHYKPINALLVGGDLDNEPVYIDYRNQFADSNCTSRPQSVDGRTERQWPHVRSTRGFLPEIPPSGTLAERQTAGKKVMTAVGQAKKRKSVKAGPGGSEEGKWRTVNGSRVYISGGIKMSGRHAYAAYKKRSRKPSKKKSKRCPANK